MSIYLLLVLAFVGVSFAQECNDYGFACKTCDTVVQCYDGKPTSEARICREGTFCNIESDIECSPTAACTTPAPPTTTVAPNTCTEPGRFPDTTDCTQYYTCVDAGNGTLIKDEYDCPADGVFNGVKCVHPEEYDCNSSTTGTTPMTTATDPPLLPTLLPTSLLPTLLPTSLLPPLLPTSLLPPLLPTSLLPDLSSLLTDNATDSTTVPPTSSTSSSTSTTSATSTTEGPFKCTSEGSFPHPSDCKKYYRCSSSLVAYEYVCPGASTFNPSTSMCTTGPNPSCTSTTPSTSSSTTATTPSTSTAAPLLPVLDGV